MRVRGLGRLRKHGRRLRNRWRGYCTVLMYHRVSDETPDPWHLCVSPDRFDDQLRTLRQDGYEFARLGEAVEQTTARRPRIAVTFDDGYLDNLTAAMPILEAHGCPATFLYSAGLIGTVDSFWWDELQDIVLRPARLPQQLATEGWSFDLGSDAEWRGGEEHREWRAWEPPPTRRHALFRYLYDRLAAMPWPERDEALRTCWKWAGAERTARRVLCREELWELAGNPLADIGSHGLTHTKLSELGAEQQWEEMTRSRELLRELTGQAVHGFSFPNGSVAAESARFVRDAGYPYAYGTRQAVVNGESDRFLLPRIHAGNWPGAELSGVLAQF